MKNKYPIKFEREITEVINPVHYHWKEFAEKELEILMKKFGNICRSETSMFRNEILSDSVLAENLLQIGNAYSNNNIILREIVSSISNMYQRYDLKITDEIFQFLLKLTKNRKINFYISICITKMSQFDNYIHKWDYIMSIPAIAPRYNSRDTFYRVINDRIDLIPDELKPTIIAIFEKYLENPKLHKYTKETYSDLIENLRR